MSVSIDDSGYYYDRNSSSRPWEREDDPDGVGQWLAFCFGWAVMCASVGFACRALHLTWGPTVEMFGERVQLNWTQFLWFGFPIGFAAGIRSNGGGILATIGVAMLGLTSILACIAFGPSTGLLPNF